MDHHVSKPMPLPMPKFLSGHRPVLLRLLRMKYQMAMAARMTKMIHQ